MRNLRCSRTRVVLLQRADDASEVVVEQVRSAASLGHSCRNAHKQCRYRRFRWRMFTPSPVTASISPFVSSFDNHHF